MSCPAVIEVLVPSGPVVVEVVTPGPPGPIGSKWITGTSAPSSGTGSVGDFYLRANGDVYGPKASGGWGSVQFTLTGSGGAALSDDAPQALGTASAGTASTASRSDHRHAMPTAAQVAGLGTAATTDATAYATAAQGAKADSAVQPAGLASYVQSGDSRLSDAREWSADTISQAEAEAGTGTTRRAFTALRVFQAIAAWWAGSAAKSKLDGIATGATANASDAQLRDRSTHTGTQAASTITGLAAVSTSGAYGDLSGRPTLGTAAPLDVAPTGDASASQVVRGNDTRLSDARTPTGHNQAWSTITGTPTTLSGYGITDALAAAAAATTYQPLSANLTALGANGTAYYLSRANHTGTQAASTITGLAAVATSGAYSDLSGRPTLSALATATVGSGLSLSGGVLSATGSSSGANLYLNANFI